MLGDVGVRVGAHVVLLGGFVEVRDEPHRIVEHRDHVREGIPEEAGDPHGDIDPGPAEFGQRHGLEVDDAA